MSDKYKAYGYGPGQFTPNGFVSGQKPLAHNSGCLYNLFIAAVCVVILTLACYALFAL